MMDLLNVLRMNAGNRESSYANSSNLQKNVILKSREVLKDTIKDYGANGFPECFKLADLGCSSGPNTFLFVENIVNSVHAACLQEKNLKEPVEFQAFLNDLPNNDFNQIFKMTPPFCSKLKNCFISGVPGSFYTRLFPNRSLHLVHSSCGVHWLSQVPDKLLDNNKKHIHMAKSSPRGVYEAYFNQFKTDLTTFLRMRSQEIIPDGRMVLTLLGRSTADHTIKESLHIYEFLAKSLQDVLAEGLLVEQDVNSFNLPIYNPCITELEEIIESESSFSVDRLESFEVNWALCSEDETVKSDDQNSSAKFVTKTIRAVTEPMLVSHFGTTFMDNIFERYALHVTHHLSKHKTDCLLNIVVVSLTRK